MNKKIREYVPVRTALLSPVSLSPPVSARSRARDGGRPVLPSSPLYSATKERTGKKKSEKKRRVGSRKNNKTREYAPVRSVCPFVLRVAVAAHVGPIPPLGRGGGTGAMPPFIKLVCVER